MSERDQHAESAAEAYDRLPDAVTDLFGDEATAESAYDLLTVDVPAATWLTALRTARDELGCSYFDWLSAVDEPGAGFRVCAHVAALGTGTVRRLLVRTTVPHEAAVLPSAIDVYAGAAWHERETHEMFGVAFEGHPHLVPLLLPEGFEGHPLRKDFVLAARVAKAWPGAKEPGEPAEGHTGPKRRAMLPPGVPDPNEWGPLKGQLPPAAARPARAARPAADRPPRRTRTAGEGSAAQRPTANGPEAPTVTGTDAPAVTGAEVPTASGPDASTATGPTASAANGPETSTMTGPEAPATPEASAPSEASAPPQAPSATAQPPAATPPQAAPTTRPRRSRSASEGSAGQQLPPDAPPDDPAAPPTAPARRSRSASDGSASQRPGPDASTPAPARPARRFRSASDGSASQRPASGAPGDASGLPPRVRSTDAPWHDARPAFDEPGTTKPADAPQPPHAPGGDGGDDSDDGDGGAEAVFPDSTQPLRRSRSGGTGAEPPVREGAGRGETPRSGPTPSDAAESESEPAPTDEPTPTPDEPAPDKPTPAPENPAPGRPAPDHPAGGDPE
ncbi:NADH-quinone oxidoreductase subunit C [Streptomyces sp. NPDC048142]|uniref:NADH-quinone oxidoreductase subunit C n=1 Tax=Streptomyces sp. NPDC048142 TaxID=3365501 RepID=UPI003710E3A6